MTRPTPLTLLLALSLLLLAHAAPARAGWADAVLNPDEEGAAVPDAASEEWVGESGVERDVSTDFKNCLDITVRNRLGHAAYGPLALDWNGHRDLPLRIAAGRISECVQQAGGGRDLDLNWERRLVCAGQHGDADTVRSVMRWAGTRAYPWGRQYKPLCPDVYEAFVVRPMAARAKEDPGLYGPILRIGLLSGTDEINTEDILIGALEAEEPETRLEALYRLDKFHPDALSDERLQALAFDLESFDVNQGVGWTSLSRHIPNLAIPMQNGDASKPVLPHKISALAMNRLRLRHKDFYETFDYFAAAAAPPGQGSWGQAAAEADGDQRETALYMIMNKLRRDDVERRAHWRLLPLLRQMNCDEDAKVRCAAFNAMLTLRQRDPELDRRAGEADDEAAKRMFCGSRTVQGGGEPGTLTETVIGYWSTCTPGVGGADGDPVCGSGADTSACQ